MSAISFGQFRTSGIAGAARFTATSTYFEPPGLYFSFGQFRTSGIAGAARFTATSTYFEPPLHSKGKPYARQGFPKPSPHGGRWAALAARMRRHIPRECYGISLHLISLARPTPHSAAFAAADGPLLSLRDISPARRGNYLKGKPYARRGFRCILLQQKGTACSG